MTAQKTLWGVEYRTRRWRRNSRGKLVAKKWGRWKFLESHVHTRHGAALISKRILTNAHKGMAVYGEQSQARVVPFDRRVEK